MGPLYLCKLCGLPCVRFSSWEYIRSESFFFNSPSNVYVWDWCKQSHPLDQLPKPYLTSSRLRLHHTRRPGEARDRSRRGSRHRRRLLELEGGRRGRRWRQRKTLKKFVVPKNVVNILWNLGTICKTLTKMTKNVEKQNVSTFFNQHFLNETSFKWA